MISTNTRGSGAGVLREFYSHVRSRRGRTSASSAGYGGEVNAFDFRHPWLRPSLPFGRTEPLSFTATYRAGRDKTHRTS